MESGTSELLLMEKEPSSRNRDGPMPTEVDPLIPFPGSGQDTISVTDMIL